jgi:predicted DNA-binding transcriptional regulator YafY
MVLQMRGRVSASVLAREFEVSERTIYRDVDALSASGVPIYAETGRNGGIALHEGYRTRLTGLTPGEAAALPLAGLAHVARDLGVSTDAAAAQLKILASLPVDSGATAQRIAARFHVDPVPWYHRQEDLPCLPALASAVWQQKRIEISYESWKGTVRRRLDPLGLVQKGGLWYLVASVREQARIYRVSNILHLQVLDVPASRPKRFDLARHWAAWTERFEERLLGARAQVLISEEGLRILRAVMPAAAQLAEETRTATARNDWVRAELPFETPDYSARQLLRLGTEVQVLAPEELRVALLNEARGVVALYTTSRVSADATGVVRRKSRRGSNH